MHTCSLRAGLRCRRAGSRPATAVGALCVDGIIFLLLFIFTEHAIIESLDGTWPDPATYLSGALGAAVSRPHPPLHLQPRTHAAERPALAAEGFAVNAVTGLSGPACLDATGRSATATARSA